MKRAGQASGRLVSTEKWRNQVAARKVARAQDQRDPETARSGAEPAPDLGKRSGACFGGAEGV